MSQTGYLAVPCRVDRALPTPLNWVRILIALVLITGFWTKVAHSEEAVILYTYHSHPPFVTGKNEGLTFDLADFLTQHANGRFVFSVSVVSRPRLNKIIKTTRAAAVPWVNPAWFGDRREMLYQWCKGLLMNDGNALISRADAKIDYDRPATLTGKVIGGLKGHKYPEIDAFIKATKAIRRVNADTHGENFSKLTKGHVDAIITPQSGAKYLIKKQKLTGKFHFSKNPESQYTRRMMVLSDNLDLKQFLEQTIGGLEKDPKWAEILGEYN